MAFFRIIIPNYNNEQWLDRCLGSIKKQTYESYGVAIVDDCSTDNSKRVIKSYCDDDSRFLLIYAPKKLWNGGSRNLGAEYYVDSEYTLYLDSDDWFADENVLQDLHDFIIKLGKPDCIRLPYQFEYDIVKKGQVPLNDDTVEKLVGSCFVACWTKCIKTKLIQPFPENTLMEDVVQHIKQCDVISGVVPFTKPVVVHNRNNTNSITRKENLDCQHGKWQSSMYRYMADLLELELKHDYCEKHRKIRADACLKNIKNGVYSQSIIK